MDLEKLTIGEARVIAAVLGGKPSSHSFVIGQAIYLQTVTHYYTGRVAVVTESDVGLDEAAWISDTRRFADAMKNGFANDAEIEPFPDGMRWFVARGSIVGFGEWKPRDLPRSQR